MAVGVALPLLFARATDAFAARTYGENTPLNLDRQKPVQAATSGGGSLVRTFVGLAIVLAVIYGLYWLLKQVKASREERASGNGLTTIATLPLGPNRSLHMIQSGREVVLIGVAEHGVTPIRTWTEAEARDAGFFDEFGDPVRTDPQPRPAGRSRGLPGFLKMSGGAKRSGFPTMGQFVSDLRARTVRR
jgi:flagellar protein FliO/FliZ